MLPIAPEDGVLARICGQCSTTIARLTTISFDRHPEFAVKAGCI
jgi:hypothetical protein